ncbi:hypothetical protein [Pseudomonas fluorescens]|uniref:hypothetical protein n=1 Tax=Pseudomonas fluorescens TaxID=294 RepID=UPI00054B40C3|nr:hypothetical protein [Pseudomonas fluorescens]KII27640.1 hypothetical protein RY26_30175 [Pseudomonas fluorescens]
MQVDPELYRQFKDAIDNFLSYPNLDELIANGDLLKVRGGYNVLTEAGMTAISAYLIGATMSNKGKPAVFKISRRRK